MQIFRKTESYQKHPRFLVLALGNFDGVHLGHQKILKRVVENARALEAVPAVFTFQEHPQKTLRSDLPSPETITSSDYRFLLMERAGIEICFSVLFDQAFAHIEAADFVKSVLISKLGTKKLCLGYNAHFGFQRKGNPAFMKQQAPAFGIEFEEIGPVEVGGAAVSSSRIRTLLKEGKLEETRQCLGRPFGILGKVVQGDGRGKKLGFPTANLETAGDILLPYGVYPVEVRQIGIEKKSGADEIFHSCPGKTVWQGVLNYGVRPTFGKPAAPVLEAHLLDYQGPELYGKTLEVLFGNRVRAEIAFPGPEALREQITKDIEGARRYFSQSQSGFGG